MCIRDSDVPFPHAADIALCGAFLDGQNLLQLLAKVYVCLLYTSFLIHRIFTNFADNERIMIALIAEKPSVAKDIARIIGATQKNDGYLSGNEMCIRDSSRILRPLDRILCTIPGGCGQLQPNCKGVAQQLFGEKGTGFSL